MLLSPQETPRSMTDGLVVLLMGYSRGISGRRNNKSARVGMKGTRGEGVLVRSWVKLRRSWFRMWFGVGPGDRWLRAWVWCLLSGTGLDTEMEVVLASISSFRFFWSFVPEDYFSGGGGLFKGFFGGPRSLRDGCLAVAACGFCVLGLSCSRW
ncbi:hypothetical protein TNCV_1091571 [Trichonephila clavipes]|nr:hypothetical protein TNCV_1091571 [Trichonephila clavipes]